MMKAINVTGGALVWEECEKNSELPADHVEIDVVWTAINRADLMQRAGVYPPPPGASDILGLEVSGRIAALGKSVTGFEIGQEVCALLTGGGYATSVAVPAVQVLPVPKGYSLRKAAAIPEVFATAWLNLYEEADLKPGERVLLHAAASGLGTAVIQLATAFGNPVFATAGDAHKLEICQQLGASGVWNRKDGSFVDAVKTWGGVDMVLDPVGGSYIAEDQKVLNVDGRIVLIGLLGGRSAEVDLGVMLVKRHRLIGSTLRSRTVEDKGRVMQALHRHVWPLLGAGQIEPLIDSDWPITRVDEAMAHVAENRNTGKVLLQVAE
ncbi:NAD(P)H-quinone oxidoreductase [Marinobacter sp. M216]|uniref:NAD(P)H-quinone oxidoreductase n=1 Tax=Marinobacter albus TaxID=3030833 RepID=A0ABT7HGA6_9GAMM|nr:MULTISPECIES: NAD(P)H-quinone oxidoreductase [unclassified Marinobacter]MBW7472474.1 NAD(P)H-quinone oxidoreductase [Marinobacter sp. F4218]MDK9559024.1 NAD(P)H-quinone oxidoreductase [Marinobacter sp. M216]